MLNIRNASALTAALLIIWIGGAWAYRHLPTSGRRRTDGRQALQVLFNRLVALCVAPISEGKDMNQRPKLLECTAVAIAIACCGVSFAADQEKDASDRGKKSTQSTPSVAPGANTNRSNMAGPGALDEFALKDRKIVVPDDFNLKDSKIVAPDKASPAITPFDNSAKPILAVPVAAPSTPVATTAAK